MRNRTVREQRIMELKHPPLSRDPERLLILHGGEPVGYLRVVALPPCLNDARLMAEWRNLHRERFFTWYTSTAESVAGWLKDVYADDDRNIMITNDNVFRFPSILKL